MDFVSQLLWKAYIDFEIGERETENVRRLYRELLHRTSHVKVSASKFVQRII